MDDDDTRHFCEIFGEYVVRIIQGLDPGPDDASLFHDYIQHHLEAAKFVVQREVGCMRSPTRYGRLDLVADWHGSKTAIECDWYQPRYKSLAKLRNFNGYRVVVLRRNGEYPYLLADIDAVVCVPVVEPLAPFLAGQASARL